jgi:hypothetical protein
MENVLNSGELKNLQPDEVLLVGARKVANGKIQLEFAEKIQAADKPMNALTVLNMSDDRFSSGARRAWVTAEIADASERFNVNFGDDGDWYEGQRGEEMDLNILTPCLNINGKTLYFKVQVLETTEPTEYQAEHVDTAAKRAGKEGDFITHNGDYIFSNTSVVIVPKGTIVKHTWLESDNAATGVRSNVGVAAEEIEVF